MIPISGGKFGEGALPQVSAATTSTLASKDLAQNGQTEKFSDVWKKIQAEYGAKQEKPREIKKSLGKDDFMKIMVTQMQHQDPTNPFKAEQMAQQMAQYASVEQLQNINQNVSKMGNQNQPLERLAMTNLIGKTVTVDRERFPYKEGTKLPLGFTLPREASQARISIKNEAGEEIFGRDLGAQKAGPGTFLWDGILANTLPAKSGNLSYHLEAKDAKGADIPIDPRAKVQVVGLSFEGKEPILLVGDPSRPDSVAMSAISKIEADAPMVSRAAPQAVISAMPNQHDLAIDMAQSRSAERNGPAQAAEVAEVQKPQNNYFTFLRGEGSKTIESQSEQESLRAAGEGTYRGPREERGFPNGLGGGE